MLDKKYEHKQVEEDVGDIGVHKHVGEQLINVEIAGFDKVQA